MTILIPLFIVVSGIGYFIYQAYHYVKKWKYQNIKVKRLKKKLDSIHGCKLPDSQMAKLDQERIIPYRKPLCFNWKDQICFWLFGKKVWISYRKGDLRAKFIVHYLDPTIWLAGFCLVSILTKLLGKIFFAWSLNWFFWLSLVTLPILGIVIFYQFKKLKKIKRRFYEV